MVTFKEKTSLFFFNNTSLFSYYKVNSWRLGGNSKLKYDKVNKNPPFLHTQILMFPFCPKSGSPAPLISMSDRDIVTAHTCSALVL